MQARALHRCPQGWRSRDVLRLVLAAIFVLSAFADCAVAQNVDQGQRILNEREAEALRRRAEKGPTGLDIQPAQSAGGTKDEQCFKISKIDVDGVTLLSPDRIPQIIAAHSKPCMGATAINALLQSINAAYIEAGFVTSRAMLPDQDVSSGKLKVVVVEARIESFKYHDMRNAEDAASDARKLATAFPGLEGGVLQLRDVEQGLDQINRLQSNKATLDIQPGQKPGGSTLVVRNKVDDQVRGQVRSLVTTGHGRHIIKGEATLDADDLLNLNDNWYLAYSGGTTTNSLSFAMSVPYGYWLLSGSATYSEGLDQLTPTSDLFNRTASGNVSLERLVYRDATKKIKVAGAYSYRWGDRWINNIALDPQPLSVVGMTTTYEQHLPGAFISLSAGADLGVRTFDVPQSASGGTGTPQTEFTKWRASGLYYGGWQSGITLLSRFSAQYVDDTLFNTEQLQIGGPETVRGFELSPVAGDRGVFLQNTVSLPFSAAFQDRKAFEAAANGLAPYLDAITPYVFADGGVVQTVANHDEFAMIAVGAGLRLQTDRVTADLYGAFPVESWGTFDAPDYEVRLSVTVKVF